MPCLPVLRLFFQVLCSGILLRRAVLDKFSLIVVGPRNLDACSSFTRCHWRCHRCLVGTRDVTFMLDVHPMSWRCHICLVCAGDVSFNAADWAVLAAASGEGAVDTCSKLNRCRWSTRARLAMPFVPPFALFCWVEWRMRGPLQSQCAVRIMVPRFPAHRKHCRAMSR